MRWMEELEGLLVPFSQSFWRERRRSLEFGKLFEASWWCCWTCDCRWWGWCWDGRRWWGSGRNVVSTDVSVRTAATRIFLKDSANGTVASMAIIINEYRSWSLTGRKRTCFGGAIDAATLVSGTCSTKAAVTDDVGVTTLLASLRPQLSRCRTSADPGGAEEVEDARIKLATQQAQIWLQLR